MKKAPSQHLTVRGVSRTLAGRLKRLSAARDESVNATVLRILEDAVGIDARRGRLARYATWTQEDLDAFDAALRSQRVIDDRLWR